MRKSESLNNKRCMVSWSGGKDSCLAMYRAIQAGAKIERLVNMKIEDGMRSRSHGLRSGVIDAQANSLGVALESSATSWADYEDNFIELLIKLKADGIDVGIFGDIDLQEHLEWEEMVCKKAAIIPSLPLWKEDRLSLVREFIELGFVSKIVAVKDELLSSDYLGRALTMVLVEEFETNGIDACGENGEFHTVVIDGPIFNKPIELSEGEKVLMSGYYFLDFEVATC